jgi:hypothetical protein
VRAFPHVLLLGDIGIGSESPIPFDSEALLARCDEPWTRSYYREVGIPLRRLVQARLAGQSPVRIGPDADRSAYDDVNSDLFAKDEFLHDAQGS